MAHSSAFEGRKRRTNSPIPSDFTRAKPQIDDGRHPVLLKDTERTFGLRFSAVVSSPLG